MQKAKRRKVNTTTIEIGDTRLQTVSHTDCGDDDDDESSVGGAVGGEVTRFLSIDEIHEEIAVTSKPCWGCLKQFSKPTQPGKYQEYENIWELYSGNKETMSQERLAELLSEYHDLKIYTPSLKQKGVIPEERWPTDMVLRHLKFHMKDFESIATNTLGVLNELIATMSNSVVLYNAQGKFIHEKNWKGVKDLLKEQREYMSMIQRSGK